MLVRGGPFGDGGVHISNPHQQTHGAIRKFVNILHLVQIPGAVVVNRRPKQRTQVPSRRSGIDWHPLIEGLHFLRNFGREIRLESRLQHGLVRPGFKIERCRRHNAILIRVGEPRQTESASIRLSSVAALRRMDVHQWLKFCGFGWRNGEICQYCSGHHQRRCHCLWISL